MNPLLKKIISTGVGRSRFFMATVGLGIALLLILLAVQTQVDFNDLLHGKFNQNETADFLVINKIITADNQHSDTKNAFTEAEITDLKKQSFVESLGEIKANNFSIGMESYSSSIPFYSDGFFEAVPDAFLDVKTDAWHWQEGQQDLPIIIPSSWLDIYNYGMALSRTDLPQLSPEAIKIIPLKITVKGKSGNIILTGHVVALSDRIVSVLVPQTFLDWANKNYGYNNDVVKTTRVVIKTKDPSNPKLASYLAQKNLSTNTDKTRFSKAREAVNIVVGVVSFFGIVMLLFALLVFSLFIQLTIASCKTEIALLITLGASPKQLGKFLMKQFFPSNIIIMVLCLALVAGLQWFAYHYLLGQNMFVNPLISIWTLAAAVAVLLMVFIVYKRTIGKYVKGNGI